MLEYPGGHPLPTQTAGAAVHRFVDTPQFWRLRQIEHVVKEDRVVARYQIGRQRRGGDRTRCLAIARQLKAEQTARKRADRVSSSGVKPLIESSTSAA